MFIFTPQSLTLVVAIAAKAKSIPQTKDKENISANNNNRAIVAVSLIQKPPPPTKKPSILKNVLQKALTLTAASSSLMTKKPDTKKEVKSALVKSDTIVKKPTLALANIGKRQFDYAEAQKKRKEQLIQKLKEQEEKQLKFTFHANPAPKFKKVSVAQKQSSVDLSKKRTLTKQSSLPFIHLPKTTKENIVPSCGDPERLKFLDEKKKMLVAKYQEAQFQFKAKPAVVLKKQPFQPVHNNVKVVDPKPFKLQLTERLLQRSEFDKKLHETIAIRKKQEEVRKRHEEFESRKMIRQKTEFRARANPFRNY